MRLHIKNMVCNRCKEAVVALLKAQELHPVAVALGEVDIEETGLPPATKRVLEEALQTAGFELIDNRSGRLIEGIKATVIQAVHHSDGPPEVAFSALLSAALHYEYSGLSKLFSETEGLTIEQYVIRQKIERVKELLVYDELPLAQIAWQTGYSSTAHLSAQFRKVTGMTPTAFKALHHKPRTTLDAVGRL